MQKFRRPRNSRFDWKLLDALAGLKASQNYIAERMLIADGYPVSKTSINSTIKWIERAIRAEHNMTYVEYCDKKDEHWRLTLKQKMRKTAVEDGNVTMQIFLSKQDLGYSDKVEAKEQAKVETQVEYKSTWANNAEEK